MALSLCGPHGWAIGAGIDVSRTLEAQAVYAGEDKLGVFVGVYVKGGGVAKIGMYMKRFPYSASILFASR
jgi:hypothetical protein